MMHHMPRSSSYRNHGWPVIHDGWNVFLWSVLRMCSGYPPLTFHLFLAGVVGEDLRVEELEAFSDNGGLASSFNCVCFMVSRTGRYKGKGRDRDKQAQREGIFALNSITDGYTPGTHSAFLGYTPSPQNQKLGRTRYEKFLGYTLTERLPGGFPMFHHFQPVHF